MGFFQTCIPKRGRACARISRPKGDSALFEILMRDYGHLLKVNFLFLLCCLPMVTVVLFGLLFHQYLGMLLIAAVLYLLCAVLVGPAMTCLHGITVKQCGMSPAICGMNSKMLEGQLEAERARGCPVLHAAGNGVHRGLVLYVHAVGDERAAGGIRGVQPAAAHDLLAVHDPADAVSRHAPGRYAQEQPAHYVRLRQTHAARRADYAGHRHRGGAVRARSHHASAVVPGNACTGGRHRGYVGLARDGAGVPHL